MIKGTYVFKQNDIEIGRSENIITTNGKEAILKYLAGTSTDWAGSMAIGCIKTTPSLSDLSLQYEVSRSAIVLKSYKSGTPNLIVLKGRVDALTVANIYEVGIFPSNTDKLFGTRDKLILTDFSSPTDWIYSHGSATSIPFAAQFPTSPRVGLYSLSVQNTSDFSNNNFILDLSNYSSLDTLDILASVDAGKYGNVIVTLTDVNNLNTTITYPFNGSVQSGYQILSQNLPANISTLSTISTIRIQTYGAYSEITLDAIKVSVLGEISNSTGLISRSVLTTPIPKIYGVPLDIEYYVQLG